MLLQSVQFPLPTCRSPAILHHEIEVALSLLPLLCSLISALCLSALCSLSSLCTALLVLFLHASMRRNGNLVVGEDMCLVVHGTLRILFANAR